MEAGGETAEEAVWDKASLGEFEASELFSIYPLPK